MNRDTILGSHKNNRDINQIVKLYFMLKNILKLEGAQELTKNEQLKIKGNGGIEYIICCPEDNNIGYPDCTYIQCER